MKIDIDRLTEKELIDLNHRVVERLKFLEQMYQHREMLEFGIGDKVSFHPSGRVRQIATIIKYNRKTVTVITEDGARWNVSPHLLTKIKSYGMDAGSNDNIIEVEKDKNIL